MIHEEVWHAQSSDGCGILVMEVILVKGSVAVI